MNETNTGETVKQERLVDPNAIEFKDVILPILLQNKSSGKDVSPRNSESSKEVPNIIWATDVYESLGNGFTECDEITQNAVVDDSRFTLLTRVEKERQAQEERTKVHAEVFTPGWICNLMNNLCDETWFGRPDVFNIASEESWVHNSDKIEFPQDKNWQNYVVSRRLEITCGEAPFLVSRYDVSTGEIIPLKRRFGILDRKLRVVNENEKDWDQWKEWIVKAFQSCYGYEFQGDNLLIARMNLLFTFLDYYEDKWGAPLDWKSPDDMALLVTIAETIAWNIWQMDGFNYTAPFEGPAQETYQRSIEDFQPSGNRKTLPIPCKIKDWSGADSTPFYQYMSRNPMDNDKQDKHRRDKLFEYVVGNPPYQETQEATSDTAIYCHFMDASYEIADKVILITPGRFLFNAGKTPKSWNKKMLEDPHLKVEKYISDSTGVFPGTDIKGGVAITYRDAHRKMGPIGGYAKYPELEKIRSKVMSDDFESLSTIVYTPFSYKFTDKMLAEHPEIPSTKDKPGILGVGSDHLIVTNIFDKLENIVFFAGPSEDSEKYITFVGRKDNQRVEMHIRRDYIDSADNLDKYKVLVSKANGTGALGETLATPLVAGPFVAHTQTFISMGRFDTKAEAENLLKYIKTKFARAMLGIRKVTQDNNKPTWECVPLQDFTDDSDIDWSKSVTEIDEQMYRKYGLGREEVDFIESHIQEMR